jgi:hypothetical protein
MPSICKVETVESELQYHGPPISINLRPLLVVTTCAIRTNGLGLSFESLSIAKEHIQNFPCFDVNSFLNFKLFKYYLIMNCMHVLVMKKKCSTTSGSGSSYSNKLLIHADSNP